VNFKDGLNKTYASKNCAGLPTHQSLQGTCVRVSRRRYE